MTVWIARLLAAIVVAGSSMAWAGDHAELTLLGFSPDGRYFAFEEHGVQDGSGFPYSNIYLIDTATDRWVSGTPIRVLTHDESVSLSTARSEAMDKARPLLAAHQIGAEGATVVKNPLTETSAHPHFVSFRPRSLSLPTSEDDYELKLEEYALPAPGCPDMELGMPFQGFRLSLTQPDGHTRTLAEDTEIPRSRACPFNYRLSEVVVYFPPGGEPVLVVLVSVFSYGFEGFDRRFIAVTGPLAS